MTDDGTSPPLELNMAAISEAVAEAHPDRECLLFRDRRLTWSDVARRTRGLARVLHDAGLGATGELGDGPAWEPVHDTVALYLHNGNEYLEGMLGAWKARCAPFNVNYRYVAEELEYLLSDSRAAAVIVHECFLPTLSDVMPRLASPPRLVLTVPDGSGHSIASGPRWEVRDYEEALASAGDGLPEELVRAWSGDDLYLCYTGGTTGMPKGAMWRQADFLVSALGIRRRDGSEYTSLDQVVADARGGARALAAPPLMHGAAHWNALSSWVAGGAVIIQDHPERFDPDDVLDSARRHGATSLLVVGDPMARPLVDALRARPREGLALRHVFSGGAVLSPGLKQDLIDLLGGVTIVDVLGSTESGRQGIARTAPGDDTAGGFTPAATAVVLDEHLTRRLEPDEHELGWLAQTGRVPLGYLGDEEKTRSTFPVIDGRRYSVAGDRARWRSDGSLELRGRDSVCINTGGEKVFAEEVETALKTHPGVLDAVVCGRPSTRWGEEVVALVSMRADSPASDDDLVSAAAEHLARYKLPKEIIRLGEIVRSPSGKADYRWAREVATAGQPST